jgi:FixJ family two-component response regulator
MTQMPEPTVYVVDDDASILRSLERLFRSNAMPCFCHASSDEFLRSVSSDAVGCVVLDLAMPGLNGLELQRALAGRCPLLATTFITGQVDIAATVQAMKDGAVDFLAKPFKPAQLLAVVRLGITASVNRWNKRLELDAANSRLQSLTPREVEVLRYVIGGHLNKQTGAALEMSEKTVKFHRAHVFEKLGVASVPELVRFAEKAGIRAAPRRP